MLYSNFGKERKKKKFKEQKVKILVRKGEGVQKCKYRDTLNYSK